MDEVERKKGREGAKRGRKGKRMREGLFKKDLFGETKRKIYLLIHSPSVCNGRDELIQSHELGARSFLWVSLAGAEFQGFGSSSTILPGHKK